MSDFNKASSDLGTSGINIVDLDNLLGGVTVVLYKLLLFCSLANVG